MRIPDQSSRNSMGANMTPMIDVVFLLIIFFLVSSHLARQENHYPLDLPTAKSFAPFDPERTALTISVDRETNLRIAGRVVKVEELGQVFGEVIRERGAAAALRIRTDNAVQYRYVEPILRAAALAGIADATIAVQESNES
jgi:biopolymer transport protein ExbD